MKKIASRYLRRLTFDEKLSNSFVSKYLGNPRLVILLVISILAIGITSLQALPRTLNPEVNITFVTVQTVLPGAGPEEIESLITIPLEDAVESVDDLVSLTSVSQENVSIITLEFESSVSADEAKRDVQSLVDTINDLPSDTNDPNVSTFDFENQPVLVFSLSSNTDTASLIQLSENLQNKLEDDPKIDKVVLSGTENQEIQILIKPDIAEYYGVNPLALSESIKASLSSFPSGVVTAGNSKLPISIENTASSVSEIRSIPLFVNGQIVELGEIAFVSKISKPNQLKSYIGQKDNDVERAIVFSVFKTSSSKIDVVSSIAQSIVDRELSTYGEKFNYQVSQDVSADIGEQFGELGSSFMQTLVLVFITLFIFLGIRQSFIVSFSIPLTFLISISAMNYFGLSLNFLSVFSLLLALGLLVDDAIVMTSAMTSYFRTDKFTPHETGLLVWKDFIVPIWSTTITTVWAFVPLLLSTGIIGEFIKTIPIVVSATLLASTSVAVLITLPANMYAFEGNLPKRVKVVLGSIFLAAVLGAYLLLVPNDPVSLYVIGFILYFTFWVIVIDSRKELGMKVNAYLENKQNVRTNYQRIKNAISEGFINSKRATDWYRDKIYEVITSKTKRRFVVGLVVVFSVISYLLVPFGFVKNEFFPKTQENIIFVGLELPQGTKSDVTEKETLSLLNSLKDEDDVDLVLAEIGRIPDVGNGSSSQPGENVARFTLTLKSDLSIDVAERLREKYDTYPNGKISIVEVSGGPPVGADIGLTFLGDERETLDMLADQVISYLESIEGVTNVSKSITPSVSKLSFILDTRELASRGISASEVGFWIRTYTSGFTLDSAQFDGEEYDIIYRLTSSTLDANSVGEIYIPTREGYVSLLELGEFELQPNPAFITREEGKRTLSINASISANYSVPEINAQLEAFVEELEIPAGYEWKTGGANEENQDSVNAILQAMILSALLILATMVIQLGSYRKSIIVLLVIPLAVSGVFVAFALTGTPLSFPALIGVLALFGIVVNNSIVVVEKINQNLSTGIDFSESISDAAASRVEPIMFSSLTTILGLVPITLSDPLWRGLGGAIIAGLMVSGTIMLVFIPVVYYSWFSEE